MDDSLRYSEEGELNRYLFYKDINDINFFVEDSGMEYEYEEIFKRLFGNQYKVYSIMALGGKTAVKRAFEEWGKQNPDNEKIKNVYIVDGDFDRYINRDEMIEDDHFIYLKSYNIENYLFDEEAVCSYSKGLIHKSDKEVESIIDYNYWKSTIVSEATPLFLLYCTVQKLQLGLQNVSRSEYLFIDKNTGLEKDGAYTCYYNEVKKAYGDIDRNIEELRAIVDCESESDYFSFICGKFLLTSLCEYIRSKVSGGFRKEDLRWDLVRNFDIEKLSYVRDKVISIA